MMMATYPKMRFPDGRDRALTFSYDDSVIQDMRLVELLNKYGMKGTFNLNGGLYKPENEEGKNRRMTERQVTKLFANSPHEVAYHAYTHPSLAEIPMKLKVMSFNLRADTAGDGCIPLRPLSHLRVD